MPSDATSARTAILRRRIMGGGFLQEMLVEPAGQLAGRGGPAVRAYHRLLALFCCACVVLLALVSAAQAATKPGDVLVMGRDGHVEAHRSTGATATAAERR